MPAAGQAGFQYPKVPEVNYIDREVFAKLQQLNMVPSDLSSDAEFLRRVTIDTIGSLPTPDEVRAFLADKRPEQAREEDRRAAGPPAARRPVGDQVLRHHRQQHRTRWRTRSSCKPKRSQMWHDWFRKRIAENMPYDEIVKGVLTATSRDGHDAGGVDRAGRRRSTSSWPRASTRDYAERDDARPVLAAAAAGADRAVGREDGGRVPGRPPRVRPVPQAPVRPLDAGRLPGLRQRLRAGHVREQPVRSPDVKKLVDAENAERRGKTTAEEQQSAHARPRDVRSATARQCCDASRTPAATLPPKALGGPEIHVRAAARTCASTCSSGCVRPDNPFFARSFVNRIWGHYFGVGIVDPVDDFSLANPPSNDKLLDALAKDFVEQQVRHPPPGADDPA